jgi:hypothetical protein
MWAISGVAERVSQFDTESLLSLAFLFGTFRPQAKVTFAQSSRKSLSRGLKAFHGVSKTANQQLIISQLFSSNRPFGT